MNFKKRGMHFVVAGVLSLLVIVFVWPAIVLLLTPHISFDFHLLALIFVLVTLFIFALGKFLKGDWENETLLALAGLFFTILFFVSDGSKKDLAIIQSLKSATSYNCLVAGSIFKTKDMKWDITYGYYDANVFLNNIGFVAEKYGSSTEATLGGAAYKMVYSNRLLDSIANLNIPTNLPYDTLSMINQEKNQVIVLAREISNIMGCPK